MVTVYRRNLDAVVAANETLLQGLQVLAKRQVEIAHGAVEVVVRTADRMNAEADPVAHAGLGIDAAKTMVAATLANIEEMAGIARRCQARALAILHDRTLASLDEISRALGPKGSA